MNETIRVTRAAARQVDQQQLETTAPSSAAPATHGRRSARAAREPHRHQRDRRPEQRDAGLHRERAEPGVDVVRHAAVVVEAAHQDRVEPDEAGRRRASASDQRPRRRPTAAQPEQGRDQRDADADVERVEERQVRQRRRRCRRRRRWRPASTARGRPRARRPRCRDRPRAAARTGQMRAVAGRGSSSSSAAGTTSQPSHGQALAASPQSRGDGAAEQGADAGRA